MKYLLTFWSRLSVAQAHPARLEDLAVTARRYFSVSTLSRHPDFQVVTKTGTKPDVPATQGHSTEWQLQSLRCGETKWYAIDCLSVPSRWRVR